MEFHPLAHTAAKVAPASAEPARPAWFSHPGAPDRSDQKPRLLSPEQLEAYDRDGFLLLKAKDVWTEAELKLIQASVNAMTEWPDAPGKYMKYYEENRFDRSAPKILCRIENFTQYNPGLDFLLTGDKLPVMCSDLFKQPAIMYKEKVNYKLPGGAGFAPHQDVAAGWWMYNQSLHVSCLVSIDPATVENGCLEVVAGRHRDGMLSPEWKEIPAETVAQMEWRMVPTEPGDVLFFDSYVPHRSAENNTNTSRRVLYVTYAKEAEGDWRDRYYQDKRANFPPDCERDPGKKYEYKI
jgi:hypothetical protein